MMHKAPYVYFATFVLYFETFAVKINSRMKGILFAIICLFSVTLQSQDFITIRGRVTDASTGDPLPFAQLMLSVSALGTSTNDDGLFTLIIPVQFREDTLRVAYMGYELQKIPVRAFEKKPLEIRLASRAIQLAEVEVIGLTPQEVIRRAIEHIPENYGSDSVLLTAYARVRKIVGNRLAECTEAILQDLKDGYYVYPQKDLRKKHERSNFPLLLKGRVKSDTNLVNSMGDVGRQAFCLSCFFVLDVAEMYHNTALDENMFKDYDYRMKEIVDTSGRKIYHITYDQKDGLNEMFYSGEIFISAASFAIEKMVYKPSLKAYDQYEKTKMRRPYMVNGTPGWIMEMPMGENVITYGVRNGRWSLSSIRTDYAMTFVDTQSGRKLRYQYKSDLVVTNAQWDKKTVRAFRGNKSLGVNQRWDQLAGEADPTFWAQYNYLPVEKSLGKEIEKLK
jgi:hypothetical protein